MITKSISIRLGYHLRSVAVRQRCLPMMATSQWSTSISPYFIPHRSIFLKDKEGYKEEDEEKEMLKQYIKGYLNIETKNMSESEMEKMMAKAKKMIEDEVE